MDELLERPSVGDRICRHQMAEAYVAQQRGRVWTDGEKQLVAAWIREGATDSPPWAN